MILANVGVDGRF